MSSETFELNIKIQVRNFNWTANVKENVDSELIWVPWFSVVFLVEMNSTCSEKDDVTDNLLV